MFEDLEPPALESDEQRSERHSLMVRLAVLFVVIVAVSMCALAFIWVGIEHRQIWWELLWIIPLIVLALGAGLVFELRKHW